MSQKLFAEFPSVESAAWRAAIEKDLKGADFDKKLVHPTEDGIPVRPYYRREDLPASPWTGAAPGAAPWHRGYSPERNAWAIRSVVAVSDPTAAAVHALRAAERGAAAIVYTGLKPGGVAGALASLNLRTTGVVLDLGPLTSAGIEDLLAVAKAQGVPATELKGALALDPVLDFATGGAPSLVANLDAAAHLLKANPFGPDFRPLTIAADRLQAAGASGAQELAYGLAALVELVDGLNDRGIAPAVTLGAVELSLGIGRDVLLEIAKFRAVKALLGQVLTAYGVADVRVRVTATTTELNRTLYDPNVNMLRATTEAMAAALGGVEALTVAPYDTAFRTPDEFSERISRNVQLLLQEEAYLDRVADPLGGSYAIENLTFELATKAWSLFQGVAAEGGFAAAWTAGTIPSAIAGILSGRVKNLATRRSALIGTNAYPNAKDRRLEDLRIPLAEDPSGNDLTPTRLAIPYERLRLAVEASVKAGEPQPTVLLALAGDRKMARARAGFCTGYFGCGSYAVVERDLNELDGLAAAVVETGAKIVVVCAADDDYANLVPIARASLAADVAVVVAGYPKDLLEVLRTAGADEFVYLGQNVVDTLTAFHRRLGIEA